MTRQQKRYRCGIFAFTWSVMFLILSPVYADWSGKVVGITDGDTIIVMNEKEMVKIRLAGIDCPESGQEFGRAAKRLTSDLCFSKSVLVQVETTDRYGRTIAQVKLPDGYNLSEELLRAGLAWHYKQYSSNLLFAKIETEAQAAALGIWSQKNPVAPWDWRHGSIKDDKLVGEPMSAFKGNVNSTIFHQQGCKYFNCKNCTIHFNLREDALKKGFRPCKICKP